MYINFLSSSLAATGNLQASSVGGGDGGAAHTSVGGGAAHTSVGGGAAYTSVGGGAAHTSVGSGAAAVRGIAGGAFMSDGRSFTCFGMAPNGFRRLAHIAAVCSVLLLTLLPATVVL